jgi:hypothetical protein
LKIFTADDVDVDEFCPSDVILNAEERNTVFVMSNCKNSQNLIELKIGEPHSPQFVRSRWISSNKEVTPKLVCMLPDEMVIADVSADVSLTTTLASYDRGFSFTKSVIDSTAYDLGELYDFSCVPELNVFVTLNTDKKSENEEKELVIYRGGATLNGMGRILFRKGSLKSSISKFVSYVHLKTVVVLLLDSNM